MLTLQDVLKYVEESCRRRDFFHTLDPENRKIFQYICAGKFEAVLTGRGNEKCLIPADVSISYLYRGQGHEYKPIEPSLYRPIQNDDGQWGEPNYLDKFKERLRLIEFTHLLESHPVIQNFFHRHNFMVDYEGLAQHYGIKTSVLDLTSNLDVAMFFATCNYDPDNDCYNYYNDDDVHQAILYVFNPMLDNEPRPLHNDEFLNRNIRPIGLQAFPRPGRQFAYSLHMEKGHQVKCYIYRFTFTCKDSKYYYDKCVGEMKIWDNDDILIEKARQIKEKSNFSYKIFQEAYNQYHPKGISRAKLKKALGNFICTKKTEQCITKFTKTEQEEIIDRWNNITGIQMANSIVRKSRYEFERMEGNRVLCRRKSQDYRDLERIAQENMMMELMDESRAPIGAEWINYTGTPAPINPKRNHSGGIKFIPKGMDEILGETYLTAEDYIITNSK